MIRTFCRRGSKHKSHSQSAQLAYTHIISSKETEEGKGKKRVCVRERASVDCRWERREDMKATKKNWDGYNQQCSVEN